MKVVLGHPIIHYWEKFIFMVLGHSNNTGDIYWGTADLELLSLDWTIAKNFGKPIPWITKLVGLLFFWSNLGGANMNIDQISGVQAEKFCRQAETRRFTEADQPSNVSSNRIRTKFGVDWNITLNTEQVQGSSVFTFHHDNMVYWPMYWTGAQCTAGLHGWINWS
jgi:hypothetical protein